jgi:hypothetical protein
MAAAARDPGSNFSTSANNASTIINQATLMADTDDNKQLELVNQSTNQSIARRVSSSVRHTMGAAVRAL